MNSFRYFTDLHLLLDLERFRNNFGFAFEFESERLNGNLATEQSLNCHSSNFDKVSQIQWRIQDFPEVGAPILWGRGCRHTILPNFPKNCMKLKEFGPTGGRMSLTFPLDPPL